MEWRDEALVLSTRPQGENSALAELFTRDHGRHLGLVRGGQGRRLAAHLQPGTSVIASWRARTDGQLGTLRIEPLHSRAALMQDRLALAGLTSVTAMLAFALPERQPHPRIHAHSSALLDVIGRPGWTLHYLRWELALLDELGFGLDLSACAVTGSTEDLAWVSPRTGRAVSRQGAGDWADRLLPLPPALLGHQDSALGVAEGLVTTGHFLLRDLASGRSAPALPAARSRLAELLSRQAGSL